jgi:phosphotransferase system enzyme I (PtsI)
VTIRTLDAGGDKPIPGFTQAGESNPFLGMRGIRLSLVHRDVFRLQLRALVRAAAHGPLKIMLPMVTVPEELRDARAMLQAEIDAFVREGVAVRRPKLGIMVEVPAVALSLVDFDADFFSIGSNDLTQYATAAGRDIGAVAALADPLHPGVLKMIEAIARHGRQTGIEVSLCGDAGGDPAVLPHLIRAGLRSVSVSPAAVARVKAAIAGLDLGDGGSGLRRPGEEAPSL